MQKNEKLQWYSSIILIKTDINHNSDNETTALDISKGRYNQIKTDIDHEDDHENIALDSSKD